MCSMFLNQITVYVNFFFFSGNDELNSVLNIFLGNPNFIGSVIACFLDNTVPGKTIDLQRMF